MRCIFAPSAASVSVCSHAPPPPHAAGRGRNPVVRDNRSLGGTWRAVADSLPAFRLEGVGGGAAFRTHGGTTRVSVSGRRSARWGAARIAPAPDARGRVRGAAGRGGGRAAAPHTRVPRMRLLCARGVECRACAQLPRVLSPGCALAAGSGRVHPPPSSPPPALGTSELHTHAPPLPARTPLASTVPCATASLC